MGTQSFSYTGSAQTWTVPAGVTTVTVDSYGAEGGNEYAGVTLKGKGGRVKCDITVTPGEILQVNVGGSGGAGGPSASKGTAGWNGGGLGGWAAGGGGGASDIRRGAYALADRLVVAPGGGGAGGNNGQITTGGGGNGGTPSAASGQNGIGGPGGGGPASTSAPGGAGSGSTAGGPGVLGIGADGSNGSDPRGGGAGGGGNYGGGSGGSGGGGTAGAGGGGGSGLSTGVNETLSTGVQTGNGSITLNWTASVTGYPAEVLTDTPDIYWKLEESSGASTVVDSSGNGRDASIHGTISPGFGQTALFSGLGTSAGLNGSGSSNYIVRAYDSSLDVGTGDFTVECIVKQVADDSHYVELFGRDVGGSGNGIWAALNITTGTIRLWIAGVNINGTIRISDNQPHHIVITRVSGIVKIYVDGFLDVSATAAGSTNVGSSILVGTVDGSYASINGDVSQFAYYTHSLSATRVGVHAAALGLWVPTGNPNQRADGYIYENIGFTVVESDNAYGSIYENVGFFTVETDIAAGYVDQNIGRVIEESEEAFGYIYEEGRLYVPSYWGQPI